jgi:hypothetical protein
VLDARVQPSKSRRVSVAQLVEDLAVRCVVVMREQSFQSCGLRQRGGTVVHRVKRAVRVHDAMPQSCYLHQQHRAQQRNDPASGRR